MAGVNKAIILGNLGSDPEIRYTPSGQAVANFNVATNEVWTDRDGKKQERTSWHRIVVWGRQAELCSEYLRKGRQVYLEGRIQYRDWEDKTGNKRTTTEVVANQIVFLGGGDGGRGAGAGGERPKRGGGGGGGGGSGGGHEEPGYGPDDFGAGPGFGGETPPGGGDDDIPF